jgi:glycogen operon protein
MQRGVPHPLGPTVRDGGVNFAVFSGNATGMELVLFDSATDARPSRVLKLDPATHETSHYWHCFVPGLGSGQVYGWRAHGPNDKAAGHRFDADALLLDPYGRATCNTSGYERTAPVDPDDYSRVMKSVVDRSDYDWGDDQPPARPFSQTIIYEMHVGGFTKHPSSGLPVELRGTYRGLIEKIDYLVELGITAVELLPVFHFDVQDAPGELPNYWGYSPVSFFAPHAGYSSAGGGLAALDEFRDMVKALHAAGLEVILDVVYNHTAEGDHRGPTHSLRGLDNKTYYLLDEDGENVNFSGCGNTINANVSVVRRLILDSLRYWVQEMHVDGFRFDLASILSRDRHGEPMASPPLLWDIETDPVLADAKLIAEAWDAAGLYQVGEFFGHHWREWNGKFRDDMRSFFRGDHGSVRRVAPRILGSPDLYRHRGGMPERSVNFVTSHDGFTLNDLVSYSRKHNEANGEGNRDGDDNNFSWNCGAEGPTDDVKVEALREQQIRNFLTLTLISLGAPMLLMGDEIRRTQNGNNNAYCQDNESSWFDWSQVDKNAGLRRFVRALIRLRRGLVMNQDRYGRTLSDVLDSADVLRWHGVKLHEPDWSDHSHSLAMETRGPSGIFYVILNAYSEDLVFELPAPESIAGWRLLVDTSQKSPNDIYTLADAPIVTTARNVPAHSVAVLAAAMTST